MKGCLFLFLLAPFIALSQPAEVLKMANEVSTADLQANVQKLASPEMEGRQAGTRGDTLASAFIADWFKRQGLTAPYDKGTNFFQSVPLQKIVLTKAEITVAGKQYAQFDDWYVFPGNTYKSARFDSLPVVFGGYGIVSDRYNDLLGIDVRGKAVIVMQVQPSDNLVELLSSATRSSISADYMKNLMERGAAAVLVVTGDFERSSRALKNTGGFRSYRNPEIALNPLPRIYVSEKMANDLLLQNDVSLKSLVINIKRINRPLSFQVKTGISIDLRIDSIRETARNVIGIIKGKDTAAAPVIISAHHDHLGKRGSQVFPGASDNASGTASLMEIAKLMQKSAQTGLRPKRSIIFTSFTAQEAGQLGSYYYTHNPLLPDTEIWAIYNIEMPGIVDTFYTGKTVDSNYTYFFVSDTLRHELEQQLVSANESLKLKLDDRYRQPGLPHRWFSASDGYPFYLSGASVIQTGSGFSKSYHLLTDTADKINYTLLSSQTKLSFLTLWNISNK